MKIFTTQTLALFLLVFVLSLDMKAQYVTIPDSSFRATLKLAWPTCFNGNDEMDTTCTAIVNASFLDIHQRGISSIDGIQYFDNLTTLICYSNTITNLPPLNPILQTLKCSYNDLTMLPNLVQSLRTLECHNNELVAMPNLPPMLNKLFCYGNNLTSLPVLPQSLHELRCSGNQLTNIPTLPFALTHLSCGNNLLTSLPQLPQSLDFLNCVTNNLVNLPPLPQSLRYLYCSYTNLTSLPALPQSLLAIDCNANQLTQLPSLPPSLTFLHCESNELTSLPVLPPTLTELWCGVNHLTSLPALSPALISLRCNNNLLTSLPTLPQPLNELRCPYNDLLCLPLLPEDMSDVYIDHNPVDCIPNMPPLCNCVFYQVCNDPVFICNEDKAYCSGNVYLDWNHDEIMNNGEANYRNQVVGAVPGNHASGTTYSGYRVSLDTGATSTVSVANPFPLALISVPTSHSVISNGSGEVPGSFDFALQPIPNLNDLEVDMSFGRARPGFDAWVNIRVTNAGTLVDSPLLTLTFPPDWVVLNTSPQGTVNGNIITWQDNALATFNHHNFHAQFNVSPVVPIGTPFTYIASVPLGNDISPQNNTNIINSTVTGAFDPNDKYCNTSELNPGYDLDQEIIYTVRFQNTGNDTARTILVRDTLSQYLRANTLRVVNASHDFDISFLDFSRVISVIFPNINLVDSFTNEPLSHGFVQFAVKPQPNLPSGLMIQNAANIYFDFNAPIRTNTVTTDLTFLSVPHLTSNTTLKIYPNPTSGRVRIEAPEPLALGSFVAIANMMGQTLCSTPCLGTGAEVSLDGLPAGVYSAAVVSEGRILYRGMVVKY